MREELLIPLIGLAGTIADYVTTKVGLRYPEIVELNPYVNPFLEGTFAVGGPILIIALGKRFAVTKPLTLSLATMTAAIPMVVAIRNLIIIGTVKAREYPLMELPLLYPEL